MSEFVTAFASSRPQFGLSVERLHGAVVGGGEAYARTDPGIAAASGDGRERE